MIDVSQVRLAFPSPERNFRRFVVQMITVCILAAAAWYFASNAASNLRNQGTEYGLSFLGREAGFAIGESWITYSARSSYARALTVGLLNTLYVSFAAIILTTILGTLIGIARVSRYWLLAKASFVYVELFRNVPILLQVFFWSALTRRLPQPREALILSEGFVLSNRGFVHPIPVYDPVYWRVGIAALAGLVAAWIILRWRRRAQDRTGKPQPLRWLAFIFAAGCPLLTWIGYGAPLVWDVPHLGGFNFVGGAVHSPEFMAILTALVLYTSAFAAEIVRSGIESVGRGQIEAGRSLGLTEPTILARIVLPQALRVIVPPMTTQYLNLLKDSSLGVAIGYPELVNITNTSMNQTGQVIELIVVMMSVYLFFSIVISTITNLYNRANLRKGQAR